MSRIFDALQRSGTEQTGVEYPDLVSVVTEVFEAPGEEPRTDRRAAQQAAAAEPIFLRSNLQTAPETAGFEPGIVPAGIVPANIVVSNIAPVNVAPANFIPSNGVPSNVVPASADSAGEVGPGPGATRTKEAVASGLLDFPSLEVRVEPTSKLVFLTEPDSLAAEKFRFLGVRLRQLQQSRSLKRVLVTSTIPEEGKSTVSANLAGVLARRKQSVLLIEGDLRRPVLAQQFGLGRLAGLGEWLQSGRTTLSNIYRLEGPDFWFMPSGNPPENALELLQSGRLSQLMAQFATLFDWIIVDSPPLLPLADTTVWARVTDGTLLVAREGKSQKAQLQRGLEVLKKSDLLGVVLNGCVHPDHNSYYHQYPPAAK
jgi:capsular exopolysaccharide synthesis family protein